jgi:transcription elongation factor Elf1
MAETFKCPHCGALYEITRDKAVSHNHAADCQVCGKQMGSTTNGSSIPCYELVKMPDGTHV